MALSVNTVWEVRLGTGSATNGGGFVVGASGTDWSQQATAQYASTDGVTAGTTTLTSATAAWGTDVVGNIAYVSGGTGSIVGAWYQIVSRTNATTIVVDRSTGLTSGTGVTINVGGALDSLPTLAAAAADCNKAWVKGSATQTTTATFTQGAYDSGPGNYAFQIIGYGTTRGDNGQATITLSGSTLTGIKWSGGGYAGAIRNITIDCASQTVSTGIDLSAGAGPPIGSAIVNCVVKNFTAYGIRAGTVSPPIVNCEVTGGTAAATHAVEGGEVRFCRIHDNACIGLYVWFSNALSSARFNEITNNTGKGIYSDAGHCIITNNVVHGNGGDGIYWGYLYYSHMPILNNIITKNGGYGINILPVIRAGPALDGNVFGAGTYANTSGTRHNCDDTSQINADVPYTNTHDVLLSANVSPYTNDAAGDYSLNNTAGGGALCRGAGLPGNFGGTATGHLDMGAYQHADPAGGSGGILINPGLSGGLR